MESIEAGTGFFEKRRASKPHRLDIIIANEDAHREAKRTKSRFKPGTAAALFIEKIKREKRRRARHFARICGML